MVTYWNELTQTGGHAAGYAEMVGNVPYLTQIVSTNTLIQNTDKIDPYTLYIPLQFWFCRNPRNVYTINRITIC